jgi:hypothetical protein
MMTTPTPKVSVFMPVYNAGKDLIGGEAWRN